MAYIKIIFLLICFELLISSFSSLSFIKISVLLNLSKSSKITIFTLLLSKKYRTSSKYVFNIDSFDLLFKVISVSWNLNLSSCIISKYFTKRYSDTNDKTANNNITICLYSVILFFICGYGFNIVISGKKMLINDNAKINRNVAKTKIFILFVLVILLSLDFGISFCFTE
ncbi:hypothetical protein ACBE110449_07615 [Acinetobacter bereziniae]